MSGPGLGFNGDLGGHALLQPLDPMVVATIGQTAPTVQFHLTAWGQPVSASSWLIDRGEMGSIDANGVFTPSMTVGGRAKITALYKSDVVTTSVTVQIVATQSGDPAYMNPPAPVGAGGYGGVGGDGPCPGASAAQQLVLNSAPTSDATVGLLYPYDGTVWPRGLLPPLLQWSPGAHKFDSAYLHIQEKNYEYKGYLAANNAGNFVNLPLPQDVWNKLTLSNTGDTVQVSLVFAQGANAYGPYTQSWKIAPATLKGTIYYNSYDTALAGGVGGTLAIKAGATAPSLITASGTCMVCHSVSANGHALVTETIVNQNSSPAIYLDLNNDTTKGAGTAYAFNDGFPALYPDGTMMLSNAGTPAGTDTASRLYSLPSGQVVTGVTGLPGFFAAGLPAFSPDGARLSFILTGGGFAGGPQTSTTALVALDFDAANKAFSNARTLYSPPMGQAATFSSFLPSGSGVVFEQQLNNISGSPWGRTDQGVTGELWWVDVATQQAHRLDALNGVNLPSNANHAAGLDATLNYEPTVNPIASGGYAWVVFTSRRLYGNVLTGKPWAATPATNKKLWVAAIDLKAMPGSDPSHPAFYLPAQEIAAGNSRGYWTVDPCHSDGVSCQSGDECCGGYCEPADGGLSCSSHAPVCAAEFDRCTSNQDCCGAANGMICVNRVCTQSQPIY